MTSQWLTAEKLNSKSHQRPIIKQQSGHRRKNRGLSQYHPFKKNESVNTGYDESKYTIETCGGIYNEGNKGEEEKDPDFPIEIKDSDVYTFAFEDNWPAYGDFDMNDLVIVMSGKKLQVDKNGNSDTLQNDSWTASAGAAKDDWGRYPLH